MSKEDLLVNKEMKVTIQRGKHDKEHPFAMISKSMLRDRSLTPADKGVLCYLLALPDNWITHPKQVAEALGISKNKIYDILRNLIINGYATKEEKKCAKGRFSSVEYLFYEEKLTEPQKIKEKSTVSRKPDTEKPCPENPYTEIGTLIDIDSKEDIYKKDITSLKVSPEPESAEASEKKIDIPKKKVKKKAADFSQEVKDLTEEILNCYLRSKSDYVPPVNLVPVMTHVEFMLRKDNRDPQKILDVLNWALADYFWNGNMYQTNPAKYLREKYDQLDKKMISIPPQKPRKFAPCSNNEKAYAILRDNKGEVL